jgi:hypothetical protein
MPPSFGAYVTILRYLISIILTPANSYSGLEPNRLVPLDSCGDSVISVSTIGSVKTMYSRIAKSSFSSCRSSVTSYDSEVSEVGKKYRFDTAPKLVKTPWEADRSKDRKAFQRQFPPATVLAPRPVTPKALPSRFFQDLPKEVYDCILRQLENVHFCHAAGVCVSCYLSDITSLSLTSRAWERASRQQL